MTAAAMHGYAGSMLGGYTPSQMGHLMAHNPEALVDMGGAASDIGLAAPPDAKLVSSVDRCAHAYGCAAGPDLLRADRIAAPFSTQMETERTAMILVTDTHD